MAANCVLFCYLVPLPAPSPVEPHEDARSPYEAPPEIAASLRKRKKKLNPLHVFGGDTFFPDFSLLVCHSLRVPFFASFCYFFILIM